MHRDEYGDDPFLEEDETDVAYDDGFAEAFALGEADYISSNKRHEKDRRAAVRKDTSKIVSSRPRGGRSVQRAALRQLAARQEAIRQAQLSWKKIQLLIIRNWSPSFGAMDAALLAIMGNAYTRYLIQMVNEKLQDPTIAGSEDLISVGARTLISRSHNERGATHREYDTPKQREELTRSVYEGLDVAERVIKMYSSSVGSGETEDWEAMPDLTDDLEAIASADEDDFTSEEVPAGKRGRARAAPGASNGASPSDRRLAAEALRRCAKYLLRMERRLIEAGR